MLVAALSFLGMAGLASAGTITFTGQIGTGSVYAASATFVSSGNTLTITLTNTATGVTANNAQLLENVFWTSNTLGTVGSQAYLSGVTYGPSSGPVTPATTASNFGVYGFGTGSGAPVLGEYGVGGTAWLLNFDSTHLLALGTDPNVTNPDNTPNGPDGGIASASTTTYSNKNVISNSLTFTIHTNGELDVGSIGNVVFTYGTGLEDFKSIPPTVPVPAAIWSGMALLGGLGAAAKLRKRAGA